MKSKLGFFIIFMLFFMSFSSVPAKDVKDKEELRRTSQLIKEGKELYKIRDYYGAVEKWTAVVKIDPWNEEAKFLIEDTLKIIEDLTEKLNDGFTKIDEGRVDDAYDSFLYVKDKINPKSKNLYPLVARGFKTIEELKNRGKYDKLIVKGDDFYDVGEYDDALGMYTFAKKFYPEGNLADSRLVKIERAKRILELREMGISFFEKGEYGLSKQAWLDLIELDPNNEEALMYLSKIAFMESEKDRLLVLAKSYFDNGVALYEKRRYEEALDQFENSAAMNYRVNESKKYIERIRDILQKRQQQERDKITDQVAFYLREGIKYYNFNQYKKSLSFLNEGLKLDEENTQIREYIIRDIIALKRDEEKDVPITSPFYKLIQDLKRLGREAYQRKEYHESVKFYEEILLIFPFNEHARLNLTRALGKTDPALAEEILANMYKEANDLRKRKKEREATIKLKMILEVRPDYKDARNLLKEMEREKEETKVVVTKQDERKAEELYDQGVALYREEKLQEAVRVWQKAVEINPEFVEARVFLSKAETKIRNLEKYASAKSDKQGSKKELSEDLRIKVKKHYLDGINYYMAGLYKEAISEWEEVLKIDPDYENVRINIERAKNRLGFETDQGSS